MRKKVSLPSHQKTLRLAFIALLGGAAAGCSSDAARFDRFYASASPDNLTTASIPSDPTGLRTNAPTPPSGVINGPNSPLSQAAPGPLTNGASADNGWDQPFPEAPQSASNNSIYDGLNTGSIQKKTMSQNQPVKRQELAALEQKMPAMPSQNAMPAERPLKQAAKTTPLATDPIVTGTVKKTHGKELIQQGSQNVAAADPRHIPVPTRPQRSNVAVVPTPAKQQRLASPEKVAKTSPVSGGYTVKSGDSLGKIAAQFGVGVNALKSANGLSSDNIRIGQVLKIPSASDSGKTIAQNTRNANTKPDQIKTGSTPAPSKKPQAVASVADAENKDVASVAPETTGFGKYRWPARGAVIAGYGADVDGERNDGIDISLPEGTPIKAAENGVVIYSGNGLEKFGNTVLVRHADGKVTVYAHAKSLEVQRGDKVKRGQVVALSGMTGQTKRPKLHFEVRKNSAPVNPITFLE